MLVTRTGFQAFNEYDLSATLEAQLNNLRNEVRNLVSIKQGEDAPSVAEKYKLTPLSFDIQNLSVDTIVADIPAEHFPRDYFVMSGKSYQKDVLVFYLPFIGDKNILHCVPSSQILWTEEIALVDGKVIFEMIKFNDDVEVIRQRKDQLINFLVQQANNVNKEIEQYNNSISAIITETVGSVQLQIEKKEEFLDQLGIPKKIKDGDFLAETKNGDGTRIVEKKTKTFDVFICHASEDKEYVDRLARRLKDSDITVWYDSYQIGWGDDLRPTIDTGLKNSRFGIVVFSKSFLGKKKWTEYELNGLFSMEKAGQKVVLPIWHDISQEEIMIYCPTFADRIAKYSNEIDLIIQELKNLLLD